MSRLTNELSQAQITLVKLDESSAKEFGGTISLDNYDRFHNKLWNYNKDITFDWRGVRENNEFSFFFYNSSSSSKTLTFYDTRGNKAATKVNSNKNSNPPKCHKIVIYKNGVSAVTLNVEISTLYEKILLNISGNAKPIPIVPIPMSLNLSFQSNELYINPNDSAYIQNPYMVYVNDPYQTYDRFGTYRASCSTYKPGYEPYHAFNRSGTGWMSDVNIGKENTSIYYDGNDSQENNRTPYTKTHNGPSFYNSNAETIIQETDIAYSKLGVTSQKVKGEWLQIQLPSDKPIYLFRYSIKVPRPLTVTRKIGDEDVYNFYPTDLKYTPSYIPNYAKDPLVNYKPHFLNNSTYSNNPRFSTLLGTGHYIDSIDPFHNNYNELVPDHLPSKYTSHFPKVFIVAGSNDGQKWEYVDQHSFIDPPDLHLISKSSTLSPIPKNNPPPDPIDDEYKAAVQDIRMPETRKGNYDNFKQGFEVDYDNNAIIFEINSVKRYSYYRLIISELFPGNTVAQISEWHLSAYVANVTPNGLSKFSDVSYNFENITENFTTNSNYSLMEIDLNSKLEWDSYSKTTDGELDSIYKKQVSDFNKAKNSKDSKVIEGFDENNINNFGYQKLTNPTKASDVIDKQIDPLSKMYGTYIDAERVINNSYTVLDDKIQKHGEQYFAALYDPEDKYDLGKSGFNRQPTKEDGWLTDNRELVLKQNSVFILSTIAVSSLIIALIMTSNRV